MSSSLRSPLLIVALFFLFPSPSVLPLEPPDLESSQKLTKDLLKLDLGYNVLNQEVFRKSVGMNVDRIGFDDEEYEYLDDDEDGVEDRFFDGFDGEFGAETLPKPLHLVRDDDFRIGGPNPVSFWIDPSFWGRGPPSWGQSGGGGFGGRPYGARPQHHHNGGGGGLRGRRQRPPKKKFFVGDQHQCGAGSCEFFLFCWMSGGIVSGGCGGFLFACCQRPATVGSEVYLKQVSPKRLQKYGGKKGHFPRSARALQFAIFACSVYVHYLCASVADDRARGSFELQHHRGRLRRALRPTILDTRCSKA